MFSLTRLTSLVAPRCATLAPTFSSQVFQPRFFSTKAQTSTTKSVDAKKKKKRVKDPNAPKRPTPPFMAYTTSIRPQITASNPSYGVTQVVAEGIKRWNSLTEDQKRPFVDQFTKDSARYKTEREVYEKNKPKPVKRPANAYILFSNEVRDSVVKKNPSLVPTQVVAEISRLWKSTPDSQKTKYQQQFVSEMEKYKKLNPPKPKEPKEPKQIKATKIPKVKKTATKTPKTPKTPRDAKDKKDTKKVTKTPTTTKSTTTKTPKSTSTPKAK
eukprot:TRINITY_DN3521_c0_g1_i2.p1 TRINITY_DN3521_c0_g1~~TRINITY_DN3521_c0_g1_i2.p1  ORF type:complete len:270 (-),score=72.62 TRINITY_DN3521_c0_g1_i2:170-979(-)